MKTAETPPLMQRPILRAATAVLIAGSLVRFLALGKEVVVAGVYGLGDAMDAFAAASLLPALLINLLAESMNQALLPTMVRVQEEEGHDAAQRLLSTAQTTLLTLLCGTSLALAALAHTLFPLLTSGFAPQKLELTIRTFQALLPCVVLSGFAANCAAVLNLRRQFLLPAIAPALVPAAILIAAICAGDRTGIQALVRGTLAGTLLQAIVMGRALQRVGFSLQIRWIATSEASREVVQQYGPILLSGLIASGGLLVDQAMAATLAPGSLATLVCAGRFPSVAMALLGGAVATALTPFLAHQVARREWKGCRRTLRRWTLLTTAASVPLCLLFLFTARPLIRITLQHGAFHQAETFSVAPVLAMYALQIPFYTVSRVYYRFLLAVRRSDLIFRCGAINLALDILLNLLLMRWMGVAGIALSTSLWTIATFFFLGYWCRRVLHEKFAEGNGNPTSSRLHLST